MTAIITRDKDETPTPAAGKDGEYYDRCPKDGCIETDRIFKSGGRDSKKEEYLNWSMYNAAPKQGGCGYTWARTTKQGAARDDSKGVNPKWLTSAASTGRAYNVPSEQFRENYDQIDWSH